MTQELTPHPGSNLTTYEPRPTHPLGPGMYQAVQFTIDVSRTSWFMSGIEAWFEDRDEVILVASGTTAQGLGFIVLEWEESTIDPLFIKILESEESVLDFCVYTRSEVE